MEHQQPAAAASYSFIQLKLAAAAIVAVVAGPAASAAVAAAAELSSTHSTPLMARGGVEVSCMSTLSTLSTAPLALMPFATHSHIHTHNVRVTGTRGPVSVRDVCVQGVQGSVTGPCSFWSGSVTGPCSF